MYNRYIPQNDGSFRRSRIPDPPAPQRQEPRREEARWEEQTAQEEPRREQNNSYSPPPRPKSRQEPLTVADFLRQLLPKGFDAEDLMVVLLLLLMTGDCREDQNTALLTLVLYLFL